MATECLSSFLLLIAQTDPRAVPKLETSTWIALVIGAAATVFVMLRAKTKRNKDPLERSQTTSGLSQQRAVERQMSNLLVELSEMSRGISAGLDTRAAKLEALLEEADRKIAHLQALNDDRKALDRSGPSGPTMMIAPDRETPATPSTDEVDPRYEQIYALADEGSSVHDIAARLGQPIGEVELILALRTRRAS